MKIESFFIRGFKSIEEIHLDLENKDNVLIGKNGTGKTQILQAIDLFFNHKDADELMNNWQNKRITLSSKLNLNKTEATNIFGITGAKFVKNTTNIYDIRIVINNKTISYSIDEKDCSNDLSIQIFTRLRKYLVVHFIKINSHYIDDYSEFIEKITDKNNSADVLDQEITKNIRSTVDENLTVYSKIDYSYKLEFGNGEFSTDHLNLNSGNLKSNFIQFSINAFKDLQKQKRKLFLLIDEFDIHFHPQLQIRKYQEIINEKNLLGSLITTHSRELIDSLLIKQVHLLEGGKCLNVNLEALPVIINDTKVNGKLLFSDYTIFVEGKTDEYFFEKLINHKIMDDLIDFNIEVCCLQGCNNASKLDEFLKENKLKNNLFLLDQDKLRPFKVHSETTDDLINQISMKFNLPASDLKNYFTSNNFKLQKKGFKIMKKNLPTFSKKKGVSSVRHFYNEYDLEIDLVRKIKCRNSIIKILKINNSSIESILQQHSEGRLSIKKNIFSITDDIFSKQNLEIGDLPTVYGEILEKIRKDLAPMTN